MKRLTMTQAVLTTMAAGVLAGSLLPLSPFVDTTPTTSVAPVVLETVGTAAVQEDDPRWNCMTMGNRICGPNWKPVPQELGDALAEGVSEAPENADTRDWEACLVDEGDTTYIVCPDGYTMTS